MTATATRNRTQYVITLNGVEITSRTEKPAAIKLAQGFTGSDDALQVTVEAQPSGKVVFEYTAPKGEAETKAPRAKPFTRKVTVADAPALEGYTAAYSRSRTGAVVYRADDRSGYLVAAYGALTPVKNTTEARAVTNELERTRVRPQARGN